MTFQVNGRQIDRPLQGRQPAPRWLAAALLCALGFAGMAAGQDAPERADGEALSAVEPEAVDDAVASEGPTGGMTASAEPVEHLPKARSVNLGEPIAVEEATLVPLETASETADARRSLPAIPPMRLLGAEVPPLTSTRLSWSPSQLFEGLASPTPVLVVHGGKAGPTLCITAALHGDEINGIEIVRRVLYEIDPEDLSGSVIGVPIVNMQGFQRSSRYLPDRRDLNRYFPGYERGSAASRIAYSFFNEVIDHCTVLVDLHTGSFDRTNLPQLRADLSNDLVMEVTQGFGTTTVLHSVGSVGTLRRAATEHGIPAVTIEAGGPIRLQEDAIKHSVKSINTLMNHLGMVAKSRSWGSRQPVYYDSRWVRAESGGMLLSEVKLGQLVKRKEVLGTIINPITNVQTEVRSPLTGRVLGMAYDQVVMPGYAAYHIGITAPAEELPTMELEDPADPTQDVSEEDGEGPDTVGITEDADESEVTRIPDEEPSSD